VKGYFLQNPSLFFLQVHSASYLFGICTSYFTHPHLTWVCRVSGRVVVFCHAAIHVSYLLLEIVCQKSIKVSHNPWVAPNTNSQYQTQHSHGSSSSYSSCLFCWLNLFTRQLASCLLPKIMFVCQHPGVLIGGLARGCVEGSCSFECGWHLHPKCCNPLHFGRDTCGNVSV
jgi:hypothetical protein